jgi:hypothetical protein
VRFFGLFNELCLCCPLPISAFDEECLIHSLFDKLGRQKKRL